MKECDKGTAEPGKHLGPFEFVEAQEELDIERCQACGNVVLRRGDDGKNGKRAQRQTEGTKEG